MATRAKPRLALLLLAASAIGAARADEVKVLAANALKAPCVELASAFERATGHRVTLHWGGTEGLARRIAGGEAADVVLIAAPNLDRLVAEGRLAPGSRTDFARSLVGVAARPGLPRPDVSTAEGLKQAVLAAGAVAYSSGPSGAHVADLFRRLGIAGQVADRVRQPPSGIPVADLLARGEADLGFQQVSELLHAPGIQYLGPLPAELQGATVYAAGLHAESASPEAARAFVRALTGPGAAAALEKAGLSAP